MKPFGLRLIELLLLWTCKKCITSILSVHAYMRSANKNDVTNSLAVQNLRFSVKVVMDGHILLET